MKCNAVLRELAFMWRESKGSEMMLSRWLGVAIMATVGFGIGYRSPGVKPNDSRILLRLLDQQDFFVGSTTTGICLHISGFEPDCNEYRCRPIEGTNSCENLDDYILQEKNQCVTKPNHICTLSDWNGCEDYKVCTKNPLFPCNHNSEWDCDTWHANCSISTTNSWDDCSST